MPSIYSRFMEKEARQWRQIYKVRFDLILSVNIFYSFFEPTTGSSTFGISDQTWIRARGGRRSLPHFYSQNAQKFPLYR